MRTCRFLNENVTGFGVVDAISKFGKVSDSAGLRIWSVKVTVPQRYATQSGLQVRTKRGDRIKRGPVFVRSTEKRK